MPMYSNIGGGGKNNSPLSILTIMVQEMKY